MAVIRVNKTSDYTVMSNIHFHDKKMSLKAKGLLSLMLSLPDGWNYSIAGLVSLSKDGRDSVMNALDELETYGFLRRNRLSDENGRFAGYDYDVFEQPYSEKPYSEKPYTEKPYTENPQQLNTKQLSTNGLSTERIKDIVDFLNLNAGTSYRASATATQRHINARINEGFTIEDFKAVIEYKCKEWLNTDTSKYIRPETLFGGKFEGYLNAARIAETKNGLPDGFKLSGGTTV